MQVDFQSEDEYTFVRRFRRWYCRSTVFETAPESSVQPKKSQYNPPCKMPWVIISRDFRYRVQLDAGCREFFDFADGKTFYDVTFDWKADHNNPGIEETEDGLVWRCNLWLAGLLLEPQNNEGFLCQHLVRLRIGIALRQAFEAWNPKPIITREEMTMGKTPIHFYMLEIVWGSFITYHRDIGLPARFVTEKDDLEAVIAMALMLDAERPRLFIN